MKISIDDLKKLTEDALAFYGYRGDEIAAISDVLLYAQLRGNNQGVVKLIGPGIPRDPEAGDITVVKETPISVRIDGRKNHAMIVAKEALDRVVA